MEYRPVARQRPQTSNYKTALAKKQLCKQMCFHGNENTQQ
jgi:hypothetical protein